MQHKFTRKQLISLSCLGAILPFATAQAIPQYTIKDLGSLGGLYAISLSVNNSGIASGFAHTLSTETGLTDNFPEHAIVGQGLTTPNDLIGLGGKYSQAYSINNLGKVIGSATLSGDANYHAFLWNGAATPPLANLTDLNTLTPTKASNSRAFDINDSGSIVGFSTTAAGTEHAVLWQGVNNTISDLGTLDGTGNSHALAINASGAVVGFSSLTGNKATHAILWNGAIKTDLGTLGGTHSAAFDINSLGDIVGSSTTTLDAAQHAFLWQANATPKMKDLTTLGGSFSEAKGISSAGDIVGYSFTAGNAAQKAFLWQSGLGIQDLNTLIDPVIDAATQTNWDLIEATAVSEDGHYIVGIANITTNNVAGYDRHAFLLKIIPPDSTPPVVSYTLTPSAANINGWYSFKPSLTWSVTDAESTVSAKIGCVDSAALADSTSTGVSFSCSATSSGGTSTTITTPTIYIDSTAPTLTVPVANNAITAAISTAGATVAYSLPTATDAGSGVSIEGVSCLPSSGTVFAIGATPVDCTVSDNVGNVATTSFVVNVADQSAPVVSYTVNPSIPSASGWYKVNPSVTWSVTDAQSLVSAKTGCVDTAAVANTSALGIGYSCSATSTGGTSATISTPNLLVDATAPTLTVPVGNSAITAATTTAGAAVTYTLPTVTDTGSGVAAAGVSCLPASGSSFAIGATTVNCSASDVAGNIGTTSFVVNVADQSAPVVSYTVTPGTPSVNGWYKVNPAVTWSVTDAQSLVTTKTGCVNTPAVANTTAAGVTLSCAATSAGGTSTTVTTPTLKVDSSAPIVSIAVGSSGIKAATSAAGAVVTYTAPTVTDAASGVSVAGVSCLPASGSVFPIGTTPVTCSATDNAGNVGSASFNVTVADQAAPVLSNCPAAVTLVQGQTLGLPTATDNVSVPTVTGVTNNLAVPTVTAPTTSLPLGFTSVTWTAKDQAGLSASCIQNVQVVAPIIERVAVVRATCSSLTNAWTIIGSSTVPNLNTVQLYTTATVPAVLTNSKLGSAVNVVKGGWLFNTTVPGVTCKSPISLRTAAGTTLNNISVTIN